MLPGAQFSVGVTETPVSPLSGEIRTGAEGGAAGFVVNELVAESVHAVGELHALTYH